MRATIWMTILMVCAGCTTLRPIEGSPTDLRQRISSGELLKAGDRVTVVTTDDKSHRFAITGINAGIIEGKTDSVPIDQVAALQKRKFSPGKTIALVGGVAVGAVVGLGIYAATHLSVGF